MFNCSWSGEENGIVVWVASAVVLFSGNGYAPMEDIKMAQVSIHMSPLWGFRGFGVLVFYTHIAPLGLQKNSSCYTHCASPERGDWTYRLL